MPGYVIHLSVGKIYLKKNKIYNVDEFKMGIIEPDLLSDKLQSHFGNSSSNPDLKKYIELNPTLNDFREGYFLHLLTDYLFYNRFLMHCSPDIYEDYDKLNLSIIKKYEISIPDEVKKIVKYKNGNPKILDEKRIFKFIEAVGKINIRKFFVEKNIKIDDNLMF